MTGKVGKFSTYPNGFPGGVALRDVPLAVPHSGKVFYVGDGDTAGNSPQMPNQRGASNSNKGTYLDPFSTLDYAVGQCLADRGDIIFVLPGYVQSITAADGVDADVDGITIIGIGSGDKQPRFEFDDTDATFAIDGDNITLQNLHFRADVSAVVKGVDVKDGADDFRITQCRFTAETLTTDEFNDAIFVTTADRGVIEHNYFDMDQAAAQSAIHYVDVCLGGEVRDNYITGDYAVACIESVTTAQEQLIIADNTLMNGVHWGLGTIAVISLLTGTTGVIQDNQCYTDVTSPLTGAVVADGCFFGGGNFVATTAQTRGMEIEAGNNGIVRATVCTGKADETDGLGLFTVVGTIDVWGIQQRAEVAASSAVTIGVQIDATDTTLDAIWVTASNLSTETAVGDYANSGTAGGAFTVVQVENTTGSPMWDTAIRCPAGQIEQTAAGTPGDLVSGYTVYWSEVSPGATVTAV